MLGADSRMLNADLRMLAAGLWMLGASSPMLDTKQPLFKGLQEKSYAFFLHRFAAPACARFFRLYAS